MMNQTPETASPPERDPLVSIEWLLERTEHLHRLVEAICKERLAKLEHEASFDRG